MANYYSLMLSPNMSLSVQGYLICTNVPICRSGCQDYRGYELEGFPGYEKSWNLDPDKMYKVMRPKEEVLHPDTIASFEGVSVVDEHPTSEKNIVTIDNERYLNCGHAQHVRRGEDLDGEVTLIADLHIKDPILREKVRPILEPENGVRDVSCGYTLKLKRLPDGTLVMYCIRGNHVAAGVPKGRGGPGIAIGDSASPEIKQTRSKKMKLIDTIFGRGLKAAVADASDEEAAEMYQLIHKPVPAVQPPARVIADSDEEPAVDAKKKAIYDAVDRCMSSMKDGVADAASMDAMHGAMGMKKPAADEKKESLEELDEKEAAGDAELHQNEKTEAEEDDKLAGDAEHAEKQVDHDGDSVFHAAGDSVKSHLKAIRPLIAGYIQKVRSERTPHEQMAIDSYNNTVKAVNKTKGNPYGNLSKQKLPEGIPALATDAAVTAAPEDFSRFYEGVSYKVGKKKHDEYLAQKGK